MEAIVIFCILFFFSFLEATLPESGYSASEQEDTIAAEEHWSKEEFLKCLEHSRLNAAEKFLKIGMAQSSNSAKDIIVDFIRTGNVGKFKFMIGRVLLVLI